MKKFVQNFNNLIKETILKVQNKTNSKFKISNFNKFLITLISLLFLYIFYLSLPTLYDKTWLQNYLENQLLKEFNINFSTSSNISYRILPKPHFLIKDTKILKKDSIEGASLANIKFLKVFVSQKNFFNKDKTIINYIKINDTNFSLLKGDLKLLINSFNKNFSNKLIEVNKSNIFFKDNIGEIIALIKISKASLLLDRENLLNLKGKIYNIPFILKFKKTLDYTNTKEINFIFKKLKLNIYDKSSIDENNIKNGENIISYLNDKISTNYRIVDDIIIFNSNKTKLKNTKFKYTGELSINPFDLKLNISIDDLKLPKLLDINSVLKELVQTKLFFNENISVNTTLDVTTKLRNEIFQNAKVNFNIVSGKINLDKTILINRKIGFLELDNSNLSLENDRLLLNTDIIITINNSLKLFSLLQTNKKFRKPIKNILINLDYDLSANQVEFNNFKINDKKISDELLIDIQDFKDNSFKNWNKSKRTLNFLLENYEG